MPGPSLWLVQNTTTPVGQVNSFIIYLYQTEFELLAFFV